MTDPSNAIEITELTVEPKNRAAFERAMRAALPILERQPGVVGVRFGKIVERAEGFILVVAWRRLEDHVVRFRASKDFEDFVGYFRPLLQRPARVLHIAPEPPSPEPRSACDR